MNTTLQNYFNSYPLKEINLNSIDIHMKNKHIAITKHECHNLLSEYLDEMRGPLGEQETSEVKRIKNELKVVTLYYYPSSNVLTFLQYCNTNGENIKIWSKVSQKLAQFQPTYLRVA